MVDEVVGAILILYFDKKLELVGNWKVFVGDEVFNSFDPACSFVECFRAVQIRLSDDSKRALTIKIKLTFWVDVSRPVGRKVGRSADKLARQRGLVFQDSLRQSRMSKQSRRYLHVCRLCSEKKKN